MPTQKLGPTRAKSKNPKIRVHAEKLRRELALHFPAAIKLQDEPKLPLKIGIHDDIAAALPGMAVWKIGLALSAYTRKDSYLAALIAGAPRVDLGGNPGKPVTEHEAASASGLLARRHPKQVGETA